MRTDQGAEAPTKNGDDKIKNSEQRDGQRMKSHAGCKDAVHLRIMATRCRGGREEIDREGSERD